MSIVWVVPMLAPSYGESPPAGEPDLIRQPGVASPPPPASARLRRQAVAPSGRTPERGSRVVSPGHGLWRRAAPGQRSQSRTQPKQSAGPAPSAPHACPSACRPARTASGGEQPRRAACPTPQERPGPARRAPSHSPGRCLAPPDAPGGSNAHRICAAGHLAHHRRGRGRPAALLHQLAPKLRQGQPAVSELQVRQIHDDVPSAGRNGGRSTGGAC